MNNPLSFLDGIRDALAPYNGPSAVLGTMAGGAFADVAGSPEGNYLTAKVQQQAGAMARIQPKNASPSNPQLGPEAAAGRADNFFPWSYVILGTFGIVALGITLIYLTRGSGGGSSVTVVK